MAAEGVTFRMKDNAALADLVAIHEVMGVEVWVTRPG